MSKTKIPARLRADVLARDDYKCLWCNRGRADNIDLHVDHIVPECFGGSTTIDNLGTLCSLCNLGKGGEYYGNYLLSTIFKVPNIWDGIITITKNDPGIGTWYYLKLIFYKLEGEGYQGTNIMHKYLIDDILLTSKNRGSSSSEIQVREEEKRALLEFKDIVKKFLFENRGFFELSGDKLVFKKFKEK